MLTIIDKERVFDHEDGKKTYLREQIFQQPGEKPIFVYSDVPFNTGPSVRSSTLIRAKELWQRFGYEPEEIEFFERREDGLYHRPDFKVVGGELRKYDTDTRQTLTEDQVTAWVTRGLLRKPEDYIQAQQKEAPLAVQISGRDWQHFDAGVAAPKLSPEEALKIHSEAEQPKRRR